MSFIDGKPRTATEEDCKACWTTSEKPGERFRCYLCGYKFVVGDYWRFVYANGTEGSMGNFLTCKDCDGENVLQTYIERCNMLRKSFWWIIDY